MWPVIDILKIDPNFRSEKSAFRAIPASTELNEIFEQLSGLVAIVNNYF